MITEVTIETGTTPADHVLEYLQRAAPAGFEVVSYWNGQPGFTVFEIEAV